MSSRKDALGAPETALEETLTRFFVFRVRTVSAFHPEPHNQHPSGLPSQPVGARIVCAIRRVTVHRIENANLAPLTAK